MSELLSARLEGIIRQRRVVALFERTTAGSWQLVLTIAGQVQQPVITIPKRDRVTACWSSACDYLDLHVPSEKAPPSVRAVRQTNRQKQIARQTGRGGKKVAIAEGTGA